jgi:hypothetical protein
MAESLNFQVAAEGFGSFLEGILPDDIATSAGAFSASMQQIRNIRAVNFENFAQVVYSIETTKGLDQVNGTNVPTNIPLAAAGHNLTALGSGASGTYTMSDFFGCMSGLPYMWQDIYSGIQTIETATLYNIYKQLYLAVTWELATASVQYTGPDGFGNYSISGITLTDSGGGYGREGASAPTVTCSWASPTSSIGTDDTNITNFGRVTSINGLTFPATSGSVPTLTIAYPPGTGSFSNSIVQGYIDAANAEIAVIRTVRPILSLDLNTAYDATGAQLLIEQRARYASLPPVPTTTRDIWLNLFPTSIYVFVDAIPYLALNTLPHMTAQTLEAISNLTLPGGQSIVAMMRQERNQYRLRAIGIELDNNIAGALDPIVERLLIANGTLPLALSGIPVVGINGTPDSPITTYTTPSILTQLDPAGNVITPVPIGYVDPNTELFMVTSPIPGGTSGVTVLGQQSPIAEILNTARTNVAGINLLGPELNGTGPARVPFNGGGTGGVGLQPGGGSIGTGGVGLQSGGGSIGTEGVPRTQPGVPVIPIAVVRAGPRVATGAGLPIDTGKAVEPGSLAGSKATTLLPVTLNAAYTAATLLPSIYTVAEAIDEVIKCNCDCWVQ